MALKTPEFVLSEATCCRTKKGSDAPDRFTRRSAQLCQKRFVPDNTCFVGAHFFAQLFVVNAETRCPQTGKRKSLKLSARDHNFRRRGAR